MYCVRRAICGFVHASRSCRCGSSTQVWRLTPLQQATDAWSCKAAPQGRRYVVNVPVCTYAAYWRCLAAPVQYDGDGRTCTGTRTAAATAAIQVTAARPSALRLRARGSSSACMRISARAAAVSSSSCRWGISSCRWSRQAVATNLHMETVGFVQQTGVQPRLCTRGKQRASNSCSRGEGREARPAAAATTGDDKRQQATAGGGAGAGAGALMQPQQSLAAAADYHRCIALC